jgi:hypothetical protein
VDSGDFPFEKTYSAPVARVARVGVRFTDYSGNEYDFQGQDHRLELVFASVINRKYADYTESNKWGAGIHVMNSQGGYARG